jgi:hypothetical protein
MSINPVSFIDLDVGQSQTYQKQLTKLNTDVVFSQVALGEGPVYRINPNGIQDIRIDNKFIDDLIDETNNADPFVFSVKSTTGSINQDPLVPFGSEIINEVRFSSPINLKSGQSKGVETGIPQANLQFFSTNSSVGGVPIDTVVFKFRINELYRAVPSNTTTESYQEQRLDLRLSVHDSSENSDINNYIALRQKSLTARINFGTTLEIPVSIPVSDLSTNGYTLSVLKGSDDAVDQEISVDVELLGFDEIAHKNFSYPRTASIGYALKATNFRSSIPEYSSLLKGLIIKVPSNYNQPILSDGQVDWREVEVSENNRSTQGYTLQDDPTQIVSDTNPLIYSGIWDGGFKFDWTQNPVWIIYDLLTNSDYGLGIPETLVDKFNFYRAAQFADAVDPNTGRFHGVDGTADGTFRYKPRNQFATILENQLGVPSGTAIKERRFITDITLSDNASANDMLTKLAASMRGVLQYSGNKLQLSLDMPNSLPTHSFGEATIINGSLSFSGIRQDDLVTGVDIIFNDAANNYLREVVRIDDPDLVSGEKEKILQLEVTGCTRRSQAVRFGQYILASNKYTKRKVSFSGVGDPEDINVGDIVSLSTQSVSPSYGYNGIIQEDSGSGTTLKLQHLGFPSITSDVFAANTNPISLRHFNNKSNKTELYLLSNTSYSLASTGNTSTGTDYIEVNAIEKWNPNISEFESVSSFTTLTNPSKNDLWFLGEIEPQNIYSTTSDKLFRVDSLTLREGGEADITASEYVSNVYLDSETLINYDPTGRITIANPFLAPNPPNFDVKATYVTGPNGAVTTRLLFTFDGGSTNMLIQKAYIPTEKIVGVLGIV